MLDYDPRDWRSHLFDINGSMLREIFSRVATVTVWSALIVVLHQFVRPAEISTTIHTLFGIALSLLLVFRTNAAYDRYWEGRRQWGSIVNISRNLARTTQLHLCDVPNIRDRALTWTVAFCDSLREHLRGVSNLGPIRERLPASEVDKAIASGHTPLAIAGRISEILYEGRRLEILTDFVFLELDRYVRDLVDCMGACERIHKTPLPYVYVVHIRRALLIYTITLPFALVGSFGWLTVPCTFLIAYFLFGIEEIGVEIEDPFGIDFNDLPLEKICATIEADLLVPRQEDKLAEDSAMTINDSTFLTNLPAESSRIAEVASQGETA